MIRIKYVVDNVIHIDYAKVKERDAMVISTAFSQYMTDQNINFKLISIKVIRDRKIKGKSKLIQLPTLIQYT